MAVLFRLDPLFWGPPSPSVPWSLSCADFCFWLFNLAVLLPSETSTYRTLFSQLNCQLGRAQLFNPPAFSPFPRFSWLIAICVRCVVDEVFSVRQSAVRLRGERRSWLIINVNVFTFNRSSAAPSVWVSFSFGGRRENAGWHALNCPQICSLHGHWPALNREWWRGGGRLSISLKTTFVFPSELWRVSLSLRLICETTSLCSCSLIRNANEPKLPAKAT